MYSALYSNDSSITAGQAEIQPLHDQFTMIITSSDSLRRVLKPSSAAGGSTPAPEEGAALTEVDAAVAADEQQVVEKVRAAAQLGSAGQRHGAAEDAAVNHLEDTRRTPRQQRSAADTATTLDRS